MQTYSIGRSNDNDIVIRDHSVSRHHAELRIEDDGSYSVDHVVEGDSVDDVLHYVQYERRTLIEKVRRTIEEALREGRISLEESARLRRRYQQGLEEYTYLSRDE